MNISRVISIILALFMMISSIDILMTIYRESYILPTTYLLSIPIAKITILILDNMFGEGMISVLYWMIVSYIILIFQVIMILLLSIVVIIYSWYIE